METLVYLKLYRESHPEIFIIDEGSGHIKTQIRVEQSDTDCTTEVMEPPIFWKYKVLGEILGQKIQRICNQCISGFTRH